MILFTLYIFVSDVNSASQALTLINGTHIDEKPVIIEFGKKLEADSAV